MSDVYSGRAEEELQYRTACREIWKKIQGSLLTDEEMAALLSVDFSTAYSGHILEYKAIAQAQLDKVLKALFGDREHR